MQTGAAESGLYDASGAYDIRITYFDEEHGQSTAQLFVGGREVINFRLNEDVDCCRWRRFENIQVNTGDEIKLVAQADQEERVRLDFVELISLRTESRSQNEHESEGQR